MKKTRILYSLAIIALCSCNNPTDKNEKDKKASEVQNAPAKSANIIHKQVAVEGEFTHLTSITGAQINYTQGDYSLEIIGDSAFVQYLKTEFDAGVLSISLSAEKNADLNLFEGKINVTINLSAPHLQCVALCSSGGFSSKGLWKADKMEFGVIGTGEFVCDSIECNTFDYQATGDGDATFAHIKADKIHFYNVGKSNITSVVDTDLLLAENIGHSTMLFSGRAKEHDLNPTRNGKIVSDL